MSKLNVGIADDNELMVHLLSDIVARDEELQVVGTACNGEEAYKMIKTKDVIPGSIIATLAWFLISFFYSYYTNNYSNYEVIYGSIGGIIVLITWLYLSSWSILIGLEVNVRLYFRKLKRQKGSV